MQKIAQKLFYLFAIVSSLYFVSCRKDNYITDTTAKLSFSTDTILFDTVFTTIGTVTEQLLVYNPHNKKIKIDNIRLAGATNGQYRINVDGDPTNNTSNIIIGPKDSLYIFIQVTIDPLNINTPLVVKDSIIFETNGNIQDVDLVAYGQDAHYYYPNTNIRGLPPLYLLNHDETWINDKPYVVFGYFAVDSSYLLKIEKGCRIHFYQSAGLWISPFATLKVNGTKEDPVTFQGFRFEHVYENTSGQWDRIWINENYSNVDNEINYAIIKNAYIGLQAEVLQVKTTNSLKVKNTIIKNCSGWGFLSRAYDTYFENSVIVNAEKNVVALANGGKHNFINCTIANYVSPSKGQRKDATLYMNNAGLDLNAYFANTIVYGDITDEVAVESVPNIGFNYLFENCLLKTSATTSSASNYLNCFTNQDPLFKDKTKLANFNIKQSSAAIDKGSYALSKSGITVPTVDIENTIRIANPDLGAYEYK